MRIADAERDDPDTIDATLRVLGVAGFTSMVSMRICDAMLPALATAFAVPTAEAAVVVSSFAIAYGVMQLVYGPLGDRHGKLRVIGIATAWCALAALAAALAPSLQWLALARAAMGGGAAAIIPMAIAWMGDQVPFTRRQEVLARYSGATVTGIVLGMFAGGILTEAFGWRSAFALVAPCFALVSFMLLRHARRQAAAPASRSLPYLRQVREILRVPWARQVLAVACAEGAICFGTIVFVPSVLHARFGMPVGEGGAVVALFGVGGFAYSRLAGTLLRRIPPPVVLRGGIVLMTAGFVLLAVMPHWSFAAAGCAVGGFGFYAFHNTLQFAATQLSTTARGTAVSLFACSLFFGQSVGVTVTALALERMSSSTVFGIAAMAMACVGAAFALLLRRHHTAIAARPVDA